MPRAAKFTLVAFAISAIATVGFLFMGWVAEAIISYGCLLICGIAVLMHWARHRLIREGRHDLVD